MAEAVKSVRGPGGGYVLARPMDQITIKQILDCVGENINPAKDIVGSESENANTVEYHLSKNYFQNLGTIMREYLVTTTLGDLMRKANDIEITPRTEESALASETINHTQQTSSTTHTQEAINEVNNSPFTSMIRGLLEKLINKTIYCDYNSTSPLSKSVISFLESGDFYTPNPSSTHQLGKKSKKAIRAVSDYLLIFITYHEKN